MDKTTTLLKRRFAHSCLILMVSSGCASSPEGVQKKLGSALAAAVNDNDEVHAALLAVDAPRLGIRGYQQAEGDAETHRPFLSASIGKLFIAVTLMKLLEEEKISLETPAHRFLPEGTLRGLVREDIDRDAVTLKHLFQHQSGIRDYFSAKSSDGQPNVLDLIRTEPKRAWSREALLQYCREHFEPKHPPGSFFEYADTNYDLLGMVIESLRDKPFYEVVREEILDPLELKGTWYHAFEDAKSEHPVETYIGDTLVTASAALSADQAGGGLYTTLADLTVFTRELSEGNPVSLDLLDTEYFDDAVVEGIDVGLRLWRIRPGGLSFFLAFLPDLVGHSGATGAFAYYVPESGAVIVGSFNQTEWAERHVEFLLAKILPAMARLPKR